MRCAPPRRVCGGVRFRSRSRSHYSEHRSGEQCSGEDPIMTDAPTPAPRRRLDATDLARIAVFAAIVAVPGLPGGFTFFGGVPITAQTLGVMLAGAILGPWLGAL